MATFNFHRNFVLDRVLVGEGYGPMPRLGFRGFTGKLRLAGSTAELIDQQHWRTFLDGLYHKHWVVYAKPPFAGPDHVFRYLGRYTHRIAISNHRLVAFDNGRVSFTMKDYTQQGLFKVMSYLKHEDFLMLC